MKFCIAIPLASAFLLAQAQVPAPQHPAEASSTETAKVQCSIEAINYRMLNGTTKIQFQGTRLLPDGAGQAKVKTKEGVSTIKAKFENLPAPSTFGEACLTYVLWAVSPEGRTANLGQLQVKKGKSRMVVTEQLPAFGLMVTAEPYFAVTRPSDAIVLRNSLGKDTKVKVELVEAKLELVPIRQYAMNLAAAPVATEPQTDLSMQQAHQAVRIAQGAGAATYAKDALARATDYLQQTQPGQGDVKGRAMAARSATQSAEEARVLAERGQRMELEASARKLTEEKLEQARQEAAQATLAKEQAVTQAKLAENDNETLRAQLMEQFNGILETKATARGLIVSMSGELFRTGQSTLEPEAREKLAKVAGILATHKGLRIEADGFTDSTGTAAINERLSASRAQAARDFLVSQGVPADAIVTRGLGAEHPVAGNDSAEGRQENRRVELVVSGEGLTDAPASH